LNMFEDLRCDDDIETSISEWQVRSVAPEDTQRPLSWDFACVEHCAKCVAGLYNFVFGIVECYRMCTATCAFKDVASKPCSDIEDAVPGP